MCWQDLGDRGSFCFCLWGQTEVTHWPPVVLCGSREGGSVGFGLGLGEGARGLPCTYRKQPANGLPSPGPWSSGCSGALWLSALLRSVASCLESETGEPLLCSLETGKPWQLAILGAFAFL